MVASEKKLSIYVDKRSDNRLTFEMPEDHSFQCFIDGFTVLNSSKVSSALLSNCPIFINYPINENSTNRVLVFEKESKFTMTELIRIYQHIRKHKFIVEQNNMRQLFLDAFAIYDYDGIVPCYKSADCIPFYMLVDNGVVTLTAIDDSFGDLRFSGDVQKFKSCFDAGIMFTITEQQIRMFIIQDYAMQVSNIALNMANCGFLDLSVMGDKVHCNFLKWIKYATMRDIAKNELVFLRGLISDRNNERFNGYHDAVKRVSDVIDDIANWSTGEIEDSGVIENIRRVVSEEGEYSGVPKVFSKSVRRVYRALV